MLSNRIKSEMMYVCVGNKSTSKELVNKIFIHIWMNEDGENIEWEGRF